MNAMGEHTEPIDTSKARARWAGHQQQTAAYELLDEIDRLRALLSEANEAFDECTGDYPKDLVEGEPWRAYRDHTGAPS